MRHRQARRCNPGYSAGSTLTAVIPPSPTSLDNTWLERRPYYTGTQPKAQTRLQAKGAGRPGVRDPGIMALHLTGSATEDTPRPSRSRRLERHGYAIDGLVPKKALPPGPGPLASSGRV